MKTIRVTYRSVFEQPVGPLNPLKLTLPGPFPVEIFGAGEKWQAREIASSRRVVYERLSRFTDPEMGKQVVEAAFTRQVQPWQIWGIVPAPAQGSPSYQPTERQLIPGVDICDCGNGAWGLYTAEDFTHISHTGPENHSGGTPARTSYRAACGADVVHRKIVSTRANVAPSCPKCAEIYQARYAKA